MKKGIIAAMICTIAIVVFKRAKADDPELLPVCHKVAVRGHNIYQQMYLPPIDAQIHYAHGDGTTCPSN